jgi:hypothetical protein
MTGVTCLAKNTQLQQDLKDIVEYIAYDRISKDKDASLSSVYNTIRKSGIEIDLQSVGYIYNETLDKNFQQIMSDQEVNDYMLRSFNDAIQRASLLEQRNSKEEQIGDNSPEVYVANGILNMFYNSEMPNENTQSDMLKMQNALWKGIQRKLKLPDSQKPKNDDQWKDVLGKALGYEQLGMTDLNGRLNSISDLYNAMRDELNEAISEARQLADPATFDRLNEMINGLEASTYSLLFSGKEARKLLDDMMKEAGFGKELKNGKTILDWNKLAGGIGSVQDIRDNVEKVLSDNGYSQDVIDGVKRSLVNEFNELQTRILDKSYKELSKREKALERVPTSKSDLRRLAELNSLGIFNGTHDKVLYDLLGVGELQQADIQDLKQLAQAASNLYREVDKNYGGEVFASRQFQALQRIIDNIIARNTNDKTKSLKLLSILKNYSDVFLTGLLTGPLTILENLWSGVKEMFVPTIMGAGLNKQDAHLYWKMLADVTSRGMQFGEEIGSFAPRELYVNSLQWKWKGGTAKEKAESLLFALTVPARVGLLGFDSANKVTITNKTFKNAIYQALTQDRTQDGNFIKGMNKEDAKKFMNEALYGQSFEDAKIQARELMDKTNNDLPDKYKIPVNNNTITTLANDLVKANLNANGAITKEVIEAAYKSSYHVAGYGLGHEANNPLSAQIKAWRSNMRKEEERLAKEKDWDKLAMHKLKSTFVNSVIIRFTAGATNWMYLRVQSAGLGLATGFMGDWNKDIDFGSKESIQQSIKDIQNARNKIGRALVGISYMTLSYMLYYALSGGDDDEDKRNKLAELNKKRDELKKTNYREFDGGAGEKAEKVSEIDKDIKLLEESTSLMKKIKGDWMGSRLFKKVSPDVLLLHYYLDTEKNKYSGVVKFVQGAYGLGSQYSTDAKVIEASKLYWKENTDAGNGLLTSIAGDRFGVPLWRAGKDWYKLGKWIGGGKVASDFEAPHNAADGIWGGGMLEDLGLYDKDPAITILPGIGGKGYEKFKTKGITNMSDLKGNWWETTFTDENGNDKYILNATDRIKAKEAAEKYKQEK